MTLIHDSLLLMAVVAKHSLQTDDAKHPRFAIAEWIYHNITLAKLNRVDHLSEKPVQSTLHNYWGISGLFEVCENTDKKKWSFHKQSEVMKCTEMPKEGSKILRTSAF
jgi:hypothetical protein